MAEHAVEKFDFDDWAGLYLENPQEFEARRSAALMIELTRGTAEQCASGRKLLDQYEAQVAGCDSQQRLKVAASMMVESAKELSTELLILQKTLSDHSERSNGTEKKGTEVI